MTLSTELSSELFRWASEKAPNHAAVRVTKNLLSIGFVGTGYIECRIGEPVVVVLNESPIAGLPAISSCRALLELAESIEVKRMLIARRKAAEPMP